MKAVKILFACIVFIFNASSTSVWAWGERGHNMTGYVAARLMRALPENREYQAEWDTFFNARTFIFGHLNNIPDISWRDRRRPDVNELNSPNHYFDLEYAVGFKPNGKNWAQFEQAAEALNMPFEIYFKQVDKKPNPFTPDAAPLNGFSDIGIAPWRIEQLYSELVDAYKCAKGKEGRLSKRLPGAKYAPSIIKGNFACQEEASREDDIGAAVMIAGVMGHFVADLAQPFHNTIDHDAWLTGQGGLHSYVETFVLHMMDDRLLADIVSEASQTSRQNKIWKRLQLNPREHLSPLRLALRLSKD